MRRDFDLCKPYLLTFCIPLLGCAGDDVSGGGGAEAGSSGQASSGGVAASTSSGAATQTASGTATPTTQPPTESNTDPATESNSGTTPTGPTASATAGSSATGDPPEAAVQFIAFGDGGEGNTAQYAVAGVMEQVCQDRGCEHAIYLGDNFYDVGVESNMDVQFTDKFELPYADVTDIPFYITLGNHDYGALGNEWYRSQFQIEYTEFSEKWTLPSEFYAFDAGGVTFISLDTAQMFWDSSVDEMRQFLRTTIAESKNQVIVAFGHHPYLSNGRHGNAGNYEGIPFPLIAGTTIKNFFDEEVCGKVHVYFSGHDHNRQWHPETCGTTFVVSGAAAKTTDFENRDGNPAPLFQDDVSPGLTWVRIANKELTMAFYDQEGAMQFEDTITLP